MTDETVTQALLPVTQADRDEAAKFLRGVYGEHAFDSLWAPTIERGAADWHAIVRLVAAVRQSHSLPGVERLADWRETIIHPNNRLLFRRMAEVAGIDIGTDDIATALRKVAALTPSTLSGDARTAHSGEGREDPLSRYVQHLPVCKLKMRMGERCDCGLSELRRQSGEGREGVSPPTQRMEQTLGAKFVVPGEGLKEPVHEYENRVAKVFLGEGRSNGAGEDAVERLIRTFRCLPLHGDAGCDKLTDDEWRQVATAAIATLSADQGEVERLARNVRGWLEWYRRADDGDDCEYLNGNAWADAEALASTSMGLLAALAQPEGEAK